MVSVRQGLRRVCSACLDQTAYLITAAEAAITTAVERQMYV